MYVSLMFDTTYVLVAVERYTTSIRGEKVPFVLNNLAQLEKPVFFETASSSSSPVVKMIVVCLPTYSSSSSSQTLTPSASLLYS